MRHTLQILLLCVLPSAACGFDVHDSRAGGLGRGVLLSRPSAVNLVNTATDGLSRGKGMFEAGYYRRYELADLDYVFVAGAWRYRQLTMAVAASQFGKTDLYAEQLLKGAVALHYHRLSLGMMLSAMQVQFGNGYGSLRAATLGLAGGVSATKFTATLSSDNLTRPRLIDGGVPYEVTHTLLVEYHGVEAFSFTGRVRVENQQKPQFGLGQSIRLSGRSAFFWGVGTAPVEYGGGIEIDVPFGAVTYAASIHPV
ncbi:MAG: hypothetical protein NTW07_10025, partial [candidate division Zixibacteria bacterium]|nr:hypothetical protein [candidate division Zixibacteria bacterium]